MSNTVKTILFSFVVSLVFSAQGAFADHQPEFKIINPLVFENEIVHLRGEFEPRNREFMSIEQPLTWFEFGTDPSNLNFETPRQSQYTFQIKEVVQGITRLQPDTIYYVQAVIKFDGDTEKSDIISFNSSELTPVNINNPIVPSNDDLETVENIDRPQVTNIITPGTSVSSRSVSGQSSLTPDLSVISPLQFFPKSKKVRDVEERERLVAVRERALLESQENLRLARTGQPRSDFTNSATNNDENGEIIIAANTNGINRSGGAIGSASVFNAGQGFNSGGANYGTLLLVVLLLVAAVLLARMTLFRTSRRPQYAYARPRPRSYRKRFTQPLPTSQKRQPYVRKKYQHMANNPAAYPRFNQVNTAGV